MMFPNSDKETSFRTIAVTWQDNAAISRTGFFVYLFLFPYRIQGIFVVQLPIYFTVIPLSGGLNDNLSNDLTVYS